MATSHAWNNGVGNTCASQAMVAWNAGDWALGCWRLGVSDSGKPVWSYVRTGRMLPDGKPEMRFVQGLANRRAAETASVLTEPRHTGCWRRRRAAATAADEPEPRHTDLIL